MSRPPAYAAEPPPGSPETRVAVVGAGPAGARAALRLAEAGWPVLLLDHRYPWEKPCGGGLNERALGLLRQTMPDIPPSPAARSLRMDAAGGSRLRMELETPFTVIPRIELQRLMVERARQAGADLRVERFTGARRDGPDGPWIISTGQGELRADYLVGADGALSPVRQAVAGPDAWLDVRPALGMVHCFHGPSPRDGEMHLVFTDTPRGYIWEFPGDGFHTVGISLPFSTKDAKAGREVLRRHLERRGWIEGNGNTGIPQLRGAMAPAAGSAHWRRGTLQGNGWALLGDAAGLVDPLTGEGIYYAIRSADLLVEALLDDEPERYTSTVRQELGPELSLAASYANRFFQGAFPDEMLTLAGRHEGIRRVLADLFSGRQSYVGLKKTLFRSCIPAALRYLMLKLTRRW